MTRLHPDEYGRLLELRAMPKVPIRLQDEKERLEARLERFGKPSLVAAPALTKNELLELKLAAAHEKVALLLRQKVWRANAARAPFDGLALVTLDKLETRIRDNERAMAQIDADLAKLG